jgi:hypothetical protein
MSLEQERFKALWEHTHGCFQCAGGTEWCPDAEEIGLEFSARIKARDEPHESTQSSDPTEAP